MPNYRVKPVLQDGYTPEYNFINLNDDNVYEEALNAYNDKTLVSVEDTDGTVFLADTITLDGTNIVLTKGGKTITIANDNTITTSGDIQTKYLHAYEFDIANFSVVGESLAEDYVILLSRKNLNGLKLSQIPEGEYILIAHRTHTELDGAIPNYISIGDTMELYANNSSSYEVSIEKDSILTKINL